MTLPAEARDGLSRVWLEILKERHPGVTWVLAPQDREQERLPDEDLVEAA